MALRRLAFAPVLFTLVTVLPSSAQQPSSPSRVQSPTRQVPAHKPTRLELEPPSSKLRSYPPHKQGCFRLKDSVWQEVPCANEQYRKEHHFRTPSPFTPAIQSEPHSIFVLGPPWGHGPISVTTPLVWGSIAMNFLSDPTLASETDNRAGTNAFSIQNNTNFFTCSTCTAGQPFPGAQPNDLAWVQFTYQNTGNDGLICIWTFDITINFANGGGVGAACQGLGPNFPTGGLTGRGAAQGAGEVIGYISCPTSANAGCLLQLMAYLPWNGGWFSVSAKDEMGLNNNWTSITGSILGEGGNSQANFTNVSIDQVINTYSCILAPQDATGYFAEPCPNPTNPFQYNWVLAGASGMSDVSGETNNLNNTNPALTCSFYQCRLEWVSTAP